MFAVDMERLARPLYTSKKVMIILGENGFLASFIAFLGHELKVKAGI